MENQREQEAAEELLNRRLAGLLPHIDLAGTDFTIDWRLRELRETGAPWNIMDFRMMEVSGSGEEYLVLFDTHEKEQYPFDQNMTALPENVVLLEIPNEIKLDPVAVAREYQLDVIDFIRQHPIQKTLTATVKPLSETMLPQIVAENLQKQGQSTVESHQSGKAPDEDTGRSRGL